MTVRHLTLHEVTTDWFLLPLVLESLTSEMDDSGVKSQEGLSTPSSTTDGTDLSKDLKLGQGEDKVEDTSTPLPPMAPESLSADKPLSSDSTENQVSWAP